MFLLLAEGVKPGEAEPEEDEKLVVAAYSKTQLLEMMRNRELQDAKTIAGLLFYFKFLEKQLGKKGGQRLKSINT
jgi:hypothetical protein